MENYSGRNKFSSLHGFFILMATVLLVALAFLLVSTIKLNHVVELKYPESSLVETQDLLQKDYGHDARFVNLITQIRLLKQSLGGLCTNLIWMLSSFLIGNMVFIGFLVWSLLHWKKLQPKA